MNTVSVIGAGPAGLQTAITLKQEGFDVTVFEEDEKIGIPENCAGLISAKGVKDIGLDLEKSKVNDIYGARIYSPNGTMLQVKKRNPVAHVISRKNFDKELVNKARKLNIHVATNTKLIDVRKQTLFVQANGRGEIRKGEYIVGADGVNSTVRHLMGIDTTKSQFIHTIQAKAIGEFNKNYVELYLGDFAKGFFAWVVPENERKARIGLGTLLGEDVSANFKEFLREKMPGVRVSQAQSSLIPYGLPLQNIQKNKMVLVGDAAFQTKATSGGGIIFGMKTGKILGETIANEIKKKDSLKNYNKNLSKINKELRMHWKIRNYINSLSNKEIDKLFEKVKKKGVEEFLEKEGDMDSPSKFIGKMAKSPKYWFMAKTLLGIARS